MLFLKGGCALPLSLPAQNLASHMTQDLFILNATAEVMGALDDRSKFWQELVCGGKHPVKFRRGAIFPVEFWKMSKHLAGSGVGWRRTSDLTQKLHPCKQRLLTPPVSVECTFCPPFPQWESFQPCSLEGVLLLETTWTVYGTELPEDHCMNFYKILVGECGDLPILQHPR